MFNRKIRPAFTLVGAGPGDPDLISLKGVKALKNAEVILYDALVSEELLQYAPDHAVCIFVGKRARKHRYSQAEINRLIITYAFSHGHVVRLKGGDPFIFGRGHEELAYVEAFGIDAQVVPGISSIAAVPGLQKIPLTKRGINESFWVITATTSDGTLSGDLYRAVRTDVTVVILMGMRKLGEIVALYKKMGKRNLPIAVIQSGSTEAENAAIGTISTIEETVRNKRVASPALIVIGEVVGLHPELRTPVMELAQYAL